MRRDLTKTTRRFVLPSLGQGSIIDNVLFKYVSPQLALNQSWQSFSEEKANRFQRKKKKPGILTLISTSRIMLELTQVFLLTGLREL